jgi:signal transduction histidine kinase
MQRLPLFEHLTPEQLAWLEDHSELITLAKGGDVYRQGDPADYFYAILAGEIQLTQDIDGEMTVLTTQKAGAFMGEVAVLSRTPYPHSARALTPSDLMRLNNTAFREMFSLCPTLVAKMFSTLAARIQSTERFARQQEKMAALGVMAAGLAHELNNPAAAVGRAAGALRGLIDDSTALLAQVARRVDDAGMAVIRGVLASADAKAGGDLDPLTRADRESALDDWLYDAALDDLVDLAPALVTVGITAAHLDDLRDQIGEPVVGDALRWLSQALNGRILLNEIEQSARRISDIVKAVKTYSYGEQAASARLVDVHEGIEDTLTIMAYKLRKHNIQVVRAFDRSLPQIEAFGSELPQVWTNIIDNAIDAMGDRTGQGGGTIIIRTGREKDGVCVEIADTGPGIPPEIQNRIFDAFFTTKAVGKGTGLGLDIAHRIISKHHGEIAVESKPGDTRFRICLPAKR